MRVIEPTEIIPPGGRPRWQPDWRPRLSGVLVSRIVAFLFDFLAIGLLVWFYGFLAAFFGFLTLGLTWLVFPVLVPLVALLYNGVTMSGPRAATWGMRIAGVEVRNIEAIVIPAQMSHVLLGNSFLNRMEMRRDGETMTLTRRY